MRSRAPGPIGNLIPRPRVYRASDRDHREAAIQYHVYDERANLVEVLGRLSRLDMARAAFDICTAQKPEQTCIHCYVVLPVSREGVFANGQSRDGTANVGA